VNFGRGKFQCAEVLAVEANGKTRGEVAVSSRKCLTSVQEVTANTSPRMLRRLYDQRIATIRSPILGKAMISAIQPLSLIQLAMLPIVIVWALG
jgi:hypothetical protein